ncbi:MAG: septal ring lytic transglycosylase RlpA family protein [Janthinobacterium lividum]
MLHARSFDGLATLNSPLPGKALAAPKIAEDARGFPSDPVVTLASLTSTLVSFNQFGAAQNAGSVSAAPSGPLGGLMALNSAVDLRQWLKVPAPQATPPVVTAAATAATAAAATTTTTAAASISTTSSATPEQVANADTTDADDDSASGRLSGGAFATPDASRFVEQGPASWYGKQFHGRRTASGERYDMYAMTAAHRTLPLASYAKVTNIRNGLSVVVRINDRGPFHGKRVIDLSYAAAEVLGLQRSGTSKVEIEGLSTREANIARREMLASK